MQSLNVSVSVGIMAWALRPKLEKATVTTPTQSKIKQDFPVNKPRKHYETKPHSPSKNQPEEQVSDTSEFGSAFVSLVGSLSTPLNQNEEIEPPTPKQVKKKEKK